MRHGGPSGQGPPTPGMQTPVLIGCAGLQLPPTSPPTPTTRPWDTATAQVAPRRAAAEGSSWNRELGCAASRCQAGSAIHRAAEWRPAGDNTSRAGSTRGVGNEQSSRGTHPAPPPTATCPPAAGASGYPRPVCLERGRIMCPRSDVALAARARANGGAHAPATADTPRSPGRTPRREVVGGTHVPAESSWQRLAAAD